MCIIRLIFGREIRKFSYSTFQHIGVWKLELAWFSNECSECTHALWCLTLLVSQVLELHERWACGLYLLCWYDWFIGCSCWRISFISLHLPSKGLSDVTGIVADTMLRNTVKDRSMVTPEIIPLDVILYVCVVTKCIQITACLEMPIDETKKIPYLFWLTGELWLISPSILVSHLI